MTESRMSWFTAIGSPLSKRIMAPLEDFSACGLCTIPTVTATMVSVLFINRKRKKIQIGEESGVEQ